MGRLLRLLVVAGAVATGACAAHGRAGAPAPRPFPQPGPQGDPAPRARGPVQAADGYGIAGTALALRGIPYADGGADLSGFDCSGLVWYVFGQHGMTVPRTVADQFRMGQRVPPTALEAGDLVFFNTKGAGATHVGIVIGGDEFVHAPSASGAVRVERLGASYWSSRFVGARRVL